MVQPDNITCTSVRCVKTQTVVSLCLSCDRSVQDTKQSSIPGIPFKC
jgi:hypothetical protein